MNDNTKKVFEMLDVEPNEEFKIRNTKNGYISRYLYSIGGENLRCSYEIEKGSSLIDPKLVLDLITGRCEIIKIPKIHPLEKQAIDLYKTLGAKWIAKDADGQVWALKEEPHKDERIDSWVGNSVGGRSLPSELEFGWLSWADDKPYYIGD